MHLSAIRFKVVKLYALGIRHNIVSVDDWPMIKDSWEQPVYNFSVTGLQGIVIILIALEQVKAVLLSKQHFRLDAETYIIVW